MKRRSTSSPCAACKFLKRRCTEECAFAPYFRADEPHKFATVHKVFGASNVSKILNEVPVQLRGDAVNSLAYEAQARIRDPVYGCVADISFLHSQMTQLQLDLAFARLRLARYLYPPPPSPPILPASGASCLLPPPPPDTLLAAFGTQLSELESVDTSIIDVAADADSAVRDSVSRTHPLKP